MTNDPKPLLSKDAVRLNLLAGIARDMQITSFFVTFGPRCCCARGVTDMNKNRMGHLAGAIAYNDMMPLPEQDIWEYIYKWGQAMAKNDGDYTYGIPIGFNPMHAMAAGSWCTAAIMSRVTLQAKEIKL